MNKIYLYKRNKYVFCCFKFILYGVLVANLLRGSFLGEGLLCNRGFAAKLFIKRYIAVVIGRGLWRRLGIVFDKKDCFGRAGFSVRYRLAALSVFGKEKTDFFRAIPANQSDSAF